METGDINDVVDVQMASQGVGCVRVKDGQIFVFTIDVLEKLLADAHASGEGRAVVFVKAGAAA